MTKRKQTTKTTKTTPTQLEAIALSQITGGGYYSSSATPTTTSGLDDFTKRLK